jgi:hypothetical protein
MYATTTIPTTTPTPLPTLRTLVLAACLALGLTGCGGGGGTGTGGQTPPTGPVQPPPGDPPPPAPPAILEFTADKAAYGIGESAVLTVRYTGGQGRIEPNVGPVASGTPVRTEALDSSREYTLVVESTTAGAVRRTLRLAVDYRNEYVAIPMAFRSAGHTATLADDGKVVLIGGTRGEPTSSYSIDVYDPASGGFRQIGTLRDGRFGHTATRLVDGRILVAGGVTTAGTPWAELVNERTGASVALPPPARRRIGHAATPLGNGRVLITGGAVIGEGGAVSDTAEIFDAATGQFRLVQQRMYMRRANHSATLMPDGRVLILGGLTAPGGSYEIAEIFDPRNEAFTAVGAVDNRERGLHATVQLPDGSVLMLGGETYTTRALNAVQRFDGTTYASSVLANLLRPRTLVEGAVSRDGRVFLFGGEAGEDPVVTETAESYSAANGPVAIASLPEARSGHTVTRLKDGRFLIVGGENRAGGLIERALLYR